MDTPIGYEDEYTDKTRLISCAYFLLRDAKNDDAKQYELLTQMYEKIEHLIQKEIP